MGKRGRQIISILVLLAIIGCFAYYIIGHFDEFRSLRLVNLWYLIVLVGLCILIFLHNGYIMKHLTVPYGINLSFNEGFGLSIVTSFYNVIMPARAGMLARAHYLKKKYGLAYTHFISTYAGATLLALWINAFFGIVSLLLLYFLDGIFNYIAFVALIVAFVIFSFVMFIPKINERGVLWKDRVIRVINSWHILRKHKKAMRFVVVNTVLQFIVGVFAVQFLYSMFGVEVSFLKVLFINSFGSLAFLIGITPGGLGIYEGVQVFAAMIVGIGAVNAIAAALLWRVIYSIVLFVIGPIYSYILFREVCKKLNFSNKKLKIPS